MRWWFRDEQVQFIDKFVEIPVSRQRQIPVVQRIRKTMETPQLPYTEKEVDVPAEQDREASRALIEQQTGAIPDPRSLTELRTFFWWHPEDPEDC